MQVSFCLPARTHLVAVLAFSSALFSPLAGCHGSQPADVVATVNGKEIQRAELERNYQIQLGENPQKPSDQEADILRLNVLRSMIQKETLQQQAAKLNLTASDEDVTAKLAEIKAPYTEEQFNNLLKQRNMSLDDLKRDIRRQLTETKLINKEIESKINITDSQIKAFYEAHKADFDLIEPTYHLAQIVVTTAPTQPNGNMPGKPGGEAAAKQRVDAAHSQLVSGVDFAAVAAAASEDPNTAPNGGDMGFAPESQLRANPAVYDAISKLKPGQFTDVIPVYDAGHRLEYFAIYRLLAREPAGQRELNDPRVQQTIHQQLHDSQKQLLQTAYLETLQDNARVRNYFAEEILKRGGQ
ncbi:MAG: SurA N-terminal domain-containing protein [Terracidiphilus sp.]